jgi:hypothetical protein
MSQPLPLGRIYVKLRVNQQILSKQFTDIDQIANPLSFFDLGGNDRYHIYGADISAYAGQTGELRFTGVPAGPNSSGSAFIDNIEFSPIAIPEPTTLSVLLGGLVRWPRNSRPQTEASVKRYSAILIPFILACGAHGQGTFRNLGFESAKVQDLAPGAFEVVPITEGIRGWTQYSSGHEEMFVAHNAISDGPLASILGPQYASDGIHITPIIEGNYMIFMTPGPSVGNDLSLAQTGTVPVDARSILFKVRGASAPILSLGGLPLNIIPVQIGSSYTLYGADATQFAGKTEELRFTTLGPFHLGNTGFFLDSIEFSAQIVPEPGTTTLLLSGLLAIAYGTWRSRKRRASSTQDSSPET